MSVSAGREAKISQVLVGLGTDLIGLNLGIDNLVWVVGAKNYGNVKQTVYVFLVKFTFVSVFAFKPQKIYQFYFFQQNHQESRMNM